MSPSEDHLDLFEGELVANVVSPVTYALARGRGRGGDFKGSLHISSFRLALQLEDTPQTRIGGAFEWVSFPLGCIKTIEQADEDPLSINMEAKDLRSARIRFWNHNAVFVATLVQIIHSMAWKAQSHPEESFALEHGSAVLKRRKSRLDVKQEEGAATEDAVSGHGVGGSGDHCHGRAGKGWQVFDPVKEYTRQGLLAGPESGVGPSANPHHRSIGSERTRPGSEDPPTGGSKTGPQESSSNGWRLFSNDGHELIPSYPLHFVVPSAMSDDDIRLVVAYRSKGRLPAVTWMDPKTKAVLARSAQPQAGLGGNSCPKDEQLLDLFRCKGDSNATTTNRGHSRGAHTANSSDSAVASAAAAAAELWSRSWGGARGSAATKGDEQVGLDGVRGVEACDVKDCTPRVRGVGSSAHSAHSPVKVRAELVEDKGKDKGGMEEDKGKGKGNSKSKDKGGKEEEDVDNGLFSWPLPGKQVEGASPNKTTHSYKGSIDKEPMGAGDGQEMSGVPRRQHFARPLISPPKHKPPAPGLGGWFRQLGPQQPPSSDPGAPVVQVPSPAGRQQGGETSEERGAGVKGTTGLGLGSGLGLGLGSGLAEKSRGGGQRGRTPDKLCILDARTAVAALGNQLKGYGVETGSRHRQTQLVFADIGNVHAVREAFDTLRNTLDPVSGQDGGSGGSMAEFVAARLLRREGGCSVLVHCSDGWDRTPQMCSSIQILLDPYFRTLEGFCVLVEKEWLSFGHQFLDVVYQIMMQFSLAFEYTEELLGFVAEHTYSGLFGTFLCDTERQRDLLRLPHRTCSIWAAVLENKTAFTNPNYQPTDDALWPSLALVKIRLWERQHCCAPALQPHPLAGMVWEDRIGATARMLNRVREREFAGSKGLARN